MLGLVMFGVGITLMLRGAVGVPPWDVLAQGLALHTVIPFGFWTNIIGFAVLLLWIPLRERIRVGTVLNALVVGPVAQVGLWLLPEQESLWVRIPMFIGGMLIVAVGTGFYLGAQLGAGPRDGVMTGLHRRFGLPIWVARTGIEVVVLAAGWLLGGNVGLGTLAFALLIGPLVGFTIPRLTVTLPPETIADPEDPADPQDDPADPHIPG